MRICKDIGMSAIDRPKTSCRHCTTFCRATCYNVKTYRRFPKAMKAKDLALEQEWQEMTGESVAGMIGRKRSFTGRVRLMTRGEAFKTVSDVEKVRDMILAAPDTVFWIPTRAWRNRVLRRLVSMRIRRLPNVKVLASLDPSNSRKEVNSLVDGGWSTMYYGDDSATFFVRSIVKGVAHGLTWRVKCPKTWDHKLGHCATCETGCFSENQIHIILKQHS